MALEQPLSYNERELLEKVAAGDEAAFARLYAHWHQLLASYIYKITESMEVTEEIIQDVFLKIWIARESLAEINNFKHFLIVVGRNKAFDEMKKNLRQANLRREWEKEAVIPLYAGEEDSAKWNNLIDAAIDSLPPRRKEVYLLSRHERLAYKQIAARLGISTESVKTHLELATRSISAFIRAHLPEFAAVYLLMAGNF